MTAVAGRAPWPLWRLTAGAAGVLLALAAVVGPLAERAHADLRYHVGAHLLLGMVAPLLLVLAAPVTLLLRVLPPARARLLSRVLRARPVRVVSHPLVAGVLDVGGLWLVYRTDLLEAASHSHGMHALVHVHMILAGYLFTSAVAGIDPMPHAPSPWTRAAALVLASAAHAVLAKTLYGHPPAGVPVEEARQAAVLLYYGGDVVELALAVLLCRSWLGRTSRRRRAATWSEAGGPVYAPSPPAGEPRHWRPSSP